MSRPILTYTKGKTTLTLENNSWKKWSVYFNVKPAHHHTTLLNRVAYSKAMKRFKLCSEAIREGKTNFH